MQKNLSDFLEFRQASPVTMKNPTRLLLIILLFSGSNFLFTGCSNTGVQQRQNAISNTQSNVLSNRSTRIQARDARMWGARDVWFQ